MPSHFTNFHNRKHSMMQSGLNELLIQNQEGKNGLNHDHPKIQALNAHIQKREHFHNRFGIIAHLLERIALFFMKIFKPFLRKDHQQYYYATLRQKYLEALLNHDTAAADEYKNELKFSGEDPEWVKSAIVWFETYAVNMKTPEYIKYKTINDFNYKIKELDRPLRVAVIGDWGTGDHLAASVLEQVFLKEPDLIIHLGDIYYSGTHKEFKDHYLDIIDNLRKKYKPIPVYNLPGNHDYYSGGHPFYEALKVNEGLEGSPPVQEASYFVLSNSVWHLQGMDTGYHDHDVRKVNEDNTELVTEEIPWHHHHLDKAIAANKKVLLFSHHQLFSRYTAIGSKCYNPKLLECFKPYIDKKQITAWFWGHEHLFEVYKPFLGLDKGRCVGHGAVPILYENGLPYKTTATVKKQKIPLQELPETLLDPTKLTNDGDIYDRGFVMLNLKNDGTGTADYYAARYGLDTELLLNFSEDL
ncbi:MAG: metallophosphoesterase family protein [Saprospiraceae bacterium]